MLTCDICGATIQIANLTEGKYYCDVCYLRKFPPTLNLATLWASPGNLYNPYNRKFIHKTAADLKKCDLILFKHQVFFSKNTSPQYEEVLLFRYFGRVRCHLIQRYNWPRDINWCLNNCS